ncbi:MAG: 3-phosphoshikimate 1-carboxyvinyltransferase [Pyrinomonadaceae bacterium]
MIIRPANRIRGQVQMPGDKSVSHRAAMIAALAEGASQIRNFSTSADCNSTLSCLKELGVSIERDADLLISGVGSDGLRAPGGPLNCGNSGTTMRLLAGILAGQDFESTLTGDESLLSRPMARIIEPLQMMGASVSSNNGRAPLVIHGHKPLNPISYELLVASAQLKSCILLAGLNADGRTEVIENEVTRDHTERMLREFGVQIESGATAHEGTKARFAAVTTVNAPARFQARDISVPGDISSAAYFIAAAALLPGSSLQVRDVGVNPTRVLFLEQLRALGLNVEITDVREESNEPVGVVRVHGSERQTSSAKFDSPMMIQGSIVPQLIDELPLLAVVGSQIEGGIEIRDAAELRVKESDRIATTAQNLRAMGAEVEEFDDGLRVGGRAQLRGAKIDPRGDHRIAMAFTVAGLLAEGDPEITDSECVEVSFPEFFDLLESMVEH